MLPHLGAGAGAGIEDAYVLAMLLSHPQTNKKNVQVSTRVHIKSNKR
jgi:salicylate hydroxylase